MNSPLVSIIIPTYNRPNYLQRAIRSALTQTYENIEVVVIDDNSTINLLPIIKQFNDKRVIYHRNKQNRGPSFSRNKGISISNGEYINFLDDDDELLPKKIELQLNKFKASKIQNIGVVTCDIEYKRFDISGIRKNHINGEIYKKLLGGYCVYGILSMLIMRKFIIKFDQNLLSNQDYDFTIRLAKKCNFDYVPKRLGIVYKSENQISFNYDKKIKGIKCFFQKYKKEFIRYGIQFYIYNWLRFKLLSLKYYCCLYSKQDQILKILNGFQRIFEQFLNDFIR